MGNGPAIVAISRFSVRYAEKCRKTKASNVRSGAVRAHSVIIGPGMRCCPSDRPIACLHSLLFHYRSGAMRTELGDQKYVYDIHGYPSSKRKAGKRTWSHKNKQNTIPRQDKTKTRKLPCASPPTPPRLTTTTRLACTQTRPRRRAWGATQSRTCRRALPRGAPTTRATRGAWAAWLPAAAAAAAAPTPSRTAPPAGGTAQRGGGGGPAAAAPARTRARRRRSHRRHGGGRPRGGPSPPPAGGRGGAPPPPPPPPQPPPPLPTPPGRRGGRRPAAAPRRAPRAGARRRPRHRRRPPTAAPPTRAAAATTPVAMATAT